MTALTVATRNNHPDVVKVLSESGVVLDEQLQVRICSNICMSGSVWGLASYKHNAAVVLYICTVIHVW